MSTPSEHPLLSELDERREQIIEGLHGVLGDHGAHVEEIGAMLEALGDALWSAVDALHAQEQGEEIGRKRRGQAKRHDTLHATIDALITLSNVRS